MSGTSESVRAKRHRVTVQLSEAEARRLEAFCAATDTRAAITPSAAVRAALADLTTPGYSAHTPSRLAVESDTGSGCERVHLSEAEAHRLRVEVTRVGTNMNQIARALNRLVIEDETGDEADGEVTLEELRAALTDWGKVADDLRTALGVGTTP